MRPAKKSLYEILGIDRDANAIDVGLAHERRRDELARRVPPDPSEAALVQQAYEVLSDPGRRAAYDASLVTAAERAAAAEQAPDLLLEEEPQARPRKPILVGAVAGVVLLAAALYFTLRAPAPPATREAPPPAPAKVVEAPPPPPKPMAPAAILAAAAGAVGQVLSYDMGGRTRSLGLAAAIDRGVFITTCHGIPAGSALVVRIGGESHSASLAMTDETLDLCRLNVADLRAPPLAIAADEPKAGDVVHALGANAKGEIALTEGTVKQMRPVPNARVIEVSVPIAPNGSGGAVFDAYGRMVGIATSRHGYGAGVHVVLPASWFAGMKQRTNPK